MDNIRARACQQTLNVTENDGEIPDNAVLRMVTGSIYDPTLRAGTLHPWHGLPYLPTMHDLLNMPNDSDLFPVADSFSYEILVGGQHFAGPFQVTVDVVPYLFVDANHGDDANGGGSPNAPLKSLTRAIEVASPRCTIKVNPGVYDLENGEQFPLVIDFPMTIHGDPANRGGADLEPGEGLVTRISGGGIHHLNEYGEDLRVSVVMRGEGAVLNGVDIGIGAEELESLEDASVALLMMGSGHRLLNSTSSHNLVGVMSVLSSSTLVENCRIFGGLVGAFGIDPLGRNRIRNCEITGNLTGIQLEDVNAFDLGTPLDLGLNTIIENYLGVEVFGELVAPQDAVGNTWNSMPLTTLDRDGDVDGFVHDVLLDQINMIDSRAGVGR